MGSYSDGQLCIAQDGLDCAYVGQTFKIWRIIDGTDFYIELRCGHPQWVTAQDIELSPDGLKKLKESTMSNETAAVTTTASNLPIPAPKAAPTKKAKSSTNKLPVTGYESQVLALRQKQASLKWIEAEVDALKDELRSAAAMAVQQAPGDVTSLSFEDGKGGNASVSMPKLDMDGNRLNIKDEVIAEYGQNGLVLGEHLECLKSYVLTGDFVEWIDQLLTGWKEQGVQVPEGLEEKVITRLSADGAAALRMISRSDDATAQLAQDAMGQFIKAASIRMSK